MTRSLLSLTALTLVLSACTQATTPTRTDDPLRGAIRLPISTALSGQSLTLREGDVTFTRRGPATVQSAGGFDYLRAQFEVQNTGSSAFDNLTLVAVAREGNAGGSAISAITGFGGAGSSEQPSLAVRSTATHSVMVGWDGTLSLVGGASDFQAFTTAEASVLTTQPSWPTHYGVNDRPLNYGFVASRCADDTCTSTSGRTITPGGRGLINVALRIPHSISPAYSFTMNFAVVNASATRVTRSVTPAETQAAASQRLSDLGVPSGGEVMTVGPAVSVATPGRTDLSTPGLKVVRAPFVTTFAGSGARGSADGLHAAASFNMPVRVAVDQSGTVFVTDQENQRIRKITPDGLVSTLAGSGDIGSTNGPALNASFNFPEDLAVDDSGNVFVADAANNMIRRISSSGEVTTLAGSGAQGNRDDAGLNATFNYPFSLTLDSAGNVYVADRNNCKIRKVTPAGTVTTFAGDGADMSRDGTGTDASFFYPSAVRMDASGTLYVADFDHRIRQLTPTAVVTTLAGSGSPGRTDATGQQASFNRPFGLAFNPLGVLYVADRDNHLIRHVLPSGVVTTLLGSGSLGSADGTALEASFKYPRGLAVDSNGAIYIADSFNHKIRKVYMP